MQCSGAIQGTCIIECGNTKGGKWVFSKDKEILSNQKFLKAHKQLWLKVEKTSKDPWIGKL